MSLSEINKVEILGDDLIFTLDKKVGKRNSGNGFWGGWLKNKCNLCGALNDDVPSFIALENTPTPINCVGCGKVFVIYLSGVPYLQVKEWLSVKNVVKKCQKLVAIKFLTFVIIV